MIERDLARTTCGVKESPRMRRAAWIVLASRTAHGRVSVVFLCSIGLVFFSAWSGHANTLTLAAVAALCVEGLLVVLNGGNCPLGPLLRRLGDETPFFELFLSPRAAKLAVPLLAVVTALGVVLLAVRTL
ncbi:MAG: hypothetical protein ACXVRZ_08840 [Gaiellaceae bacterium]